MSNRRTAKLEMWEKNGGAPQMTQGPIHSALVQTHSKMFSTVSLHPAQLKYDLERISTHCSGEPPTNQSEVAEVKQICHFMQLQAVIKIKMKKQRQVCVLNEEGQDGMTATVL